MAHYVDNASRPLHDFDDSALSLFLRYARNAVDSGGSPVVENHTASSREDSASLVQLKRAGLLATVAAGGGMIVHFTGAGRCLARDHGIHIPG